MGIYTDYGRFQKAREFKDYCNSGAGIWFAFSMGSPRWDHLVTKELSGNETTEIPNVPPSSPAAYTPLYRWFASYKEGEPIASQDLDNDLLQPQEMSLIDRSYAVPNIGDTQQRTWPDNNQVEIDAKNDTPDSLLEPTIATLARDLLEDYSGEVVDDNSVIPNSWDPDPTLVDTGLYPSPSIPAVPATYKADWDDIIDKAQTDLVNSGDNLYLFYQSDATSVNDQWTEPNDSTKFESWAYMYHMSQTRTNSYGTDINENPNARPLGLFSFIQGQARFVEPVDPEEAGSSSSSVFKYGSHYWKIVTDSSIDANHLPHHILLTVSVFPNELADSSIVENKLPVRQVSVFKFPDCVLDQIPELKPPVGGTVSRRFQVLKRDRFNLLHANDPSLTITRPYKANPTDTENTPKWEDPYNNTKRQVIIPFNCDNVLDPNPEDPDPTSVNINFRGSAEMLINDVMTARTKDVQQTDRYGYIIGF